MVSNSMAFVYLRPLIRLQLLRPLRPGGGPEGRGRGARRRTSRPPPPATSRHTSLQRQANVPPIVPTPAASPSPSPTFVPTGTLRCDVFERGTFPDDPRCGRLFCAVAATPSSFTPALSARGWAALPSSSRPSTGNATLSDRATSSIRRGISVVIVALRFDVPRRWTVFAPPAQLVRLPPSGLNSQQVSQNKQKADKTLSGPSYL